MTDLNLTQVKSQPEKREVLLFEDVNEDVKE